MSVFKRLAIGATIAAFAAGQANSSGAAFAAHSATPRGFFGVVPVTAPSPTQLLRVRRSGITAIRVPLNWSDAEPTQDNFDWTSFDAYVLPAAQSGLQVLPFAVASPRWVADDAAVLPVDQAEQRNAWADFLRAAIHRYGPGGEFWLEHPTVRAQPIRTWQIWNEPNVPDFAQPPDPARYANLVKLSNQVLRSTDAGARILLGGMFASPSGKQFGAYSATAFLARLYSIGGFRSSFQGVALDPYARSFRSLPPLILSIRRVMSRFEDGSKPLTISEFGWSSLTPGNPFGKGPAGQAAQLEGALRLFAANRTAWRLAGAYWFSLTDAMSPEACSFCNGTGLFTAAFQPKPSWLALSGLLRPLRTMRGYAHPHARPGRHQLRARLGGATAGTLGPRSD